jgi:hypothetical protein
MLERNVEPGREAAGVGVVRRDDRDVDRELVERGAHEDVADAVPLP